MLSYAFQSLQETGFDDVASEEFDNIHDLFAAILIQGVSTEVKHGLYRDYIPREESIPGVRGQIRVADTIKQHTQSQCRLVCSYDEFSLDSPHNQVLKCVMILLFRLGDVKPANRQALRKLLTYFAEVKEIKPNDIRWDSLKYHRNNASYRMLMGICHLTVKGLLITTESGANKLSSWLQDEQMYRLYEKFVLSYFVKHYPEYKPESSFIYWDVLAEEKSCYLPSMKSDITLQYGNKRLIIDTKYYNETMRSNQYGDGRKYVSENLYQIFAYVKNSDRNGTGNVAGVLLYAKTDESITPDEDLIIGVNRISLKTLDLNQEWKSITNQLESICDWLSFA